METIEINQAEQYKLYPKRFVVVGLFAGAQLMTSILMNTLSPIASQLALIYQYSPLLINLGGLLYILMHPIFTFPAAYVIDKYGTSFGIKIGCLFGIIGMLIRLFVNQSFSAILIGQLIAGIGRPFIMNCQAKLSSNWFYASKRAAITQLLTLVVNVSLIIGVTIPGIYFRNYKFTPQNNQQGKQLMFNLLLLQAIIGILLFVPNLLFQQQKPPTPPSQSGNIQRQSITESVNSLKENKGMKYLILIFGLYFGSFNSMSINLSFILKPWFGGDSMVTSLVGSAPIISGIIGVIIIGPIQRKQKRYIVWIKRCMLGSISALVVFYPLLELQSVIAACFVSAYNSFFLIPLVPIMLQFGCELLFPVGQGFVVGCLFASGNLFGFVLGSIMSMIVDGQRKLRSAFGLLFILFLFLTGYYLISKIKEEKNRQKAQYDAFVKRKLMSQETAKIITSSQ